MSTISREILKRCLFESTLDEIRKIEDLDYSFVTASEQLKNKIKNDFETAKQNKKKYYPKKIALILVATLTICFLIMFSVSAQIRTAVVDFFIEVYETFASFFIENDEKIDNPKTIETRYQPSYFHENDYTQINEFASLVKNISIWSKNSTTLEFTQYVIETNSVFLDTEDTSYEVKYIGEQKVYYKAKNKTHTVKWLAYGYSFNMNCNDSLSWEEIEKIITSLKPVTE